jgi:hypothetical protein
MLHGVVLLMGSRILIRYLWIVSFSHSAHSAMQLLLQLNRLSIYRSIELEYTCQPQNHWLAIESRYDQGEPGNDQVWKVSFGCACSSFPLKFFKHATNTEHSEAKYIPRTSRCYFLCLAVHYKLDTKIDWWFPLSIGGCFAQRAVVNALPLHSPQPVSPILWSEGVDLGTIIVHRVRSHWSLIIGLLPQNPLVFILYDVDYPASSCRFITAIDQVSIHFQQGVCYLFFFFWL